MPESIDDEVIYLTCAHCGKVTTLSYGSLTHSNPPSCPHCGHVFSIDKDQAQKEALRKAQELDSDPDALGSQE